MYALVVLLQYLIFVVSVIGWFRLKLLRICGCHVLSVKYSVMRVLATYHSINCVAYASSKSFKWCIAFLQIPWIWKLSHKTCILCQDGCHSFISVTCAYTCILCFVVRGNCIQGYL